MNVLFTLLATGLVGCLIYTLQLDDLSSQRRSASILLLLSYGALLWRYKITIRRRSGPANRASDYLIAFATETGTARSLAKQTKKRIQKAGASAAIIELQQLACSSVPAKALLVIASTTGNGDPPKSAMNWLADDSVLLPYQKKRFAVLALGDRSYPRFCQFGYDITLELQNAGAAPLFDMQLVSNADENSIEYWHQLVENADKALKELPEQTQDHSLA